MNFGKRTPETESRKILARALERGITTLDTANVYNAGASERIVGKAIQGDRDKIALATKVGLGRAGNKAEGLSRDTLMRAIDQSLERLGTSYVDVYYLHAPDHATPIEETLEAIRELTQKGKIRRFAVSNYASWQILEMITWCDQHETPRPLMSQVMYNVLVRQIEIEHVAFNRKYGVHTTVYNPLAGGLLAKPYERGAPPAGSRFATNPLYAPRYWSDRFFDLVERYRELASLHSLSLLELAYAWVAHRPGVDSVLVGPGSIDHLNQAIDACARRLPADVESEIDGIHRAFQGTDASYVR
jgi:aryl-alcohol dehydrogenase-like predicted oxidoreductase